MRRLVAGFAIVGAAIGLLVSTACGGDSKPAVGADQPVYIERIEPSSATIGDEIEIKGHGFDATDNDIGFALPEGGGWAKTAFESSVASADGRTLRFELAEFLGACAFSQLGEGMICPSVGIFVPIGDTEVAVYNRNGTSNSVPFRRQISPIEEAKRAIRESAAMEELTRLLDENVRTSISQFRGLWLEGYGVDVEQEDGDVYISLSLHGSNLDKLIETIPSEIAGYELRIDAIER